MSFESPSFRPISILLVHPNPLVQERFGQVLRAEGHRVRVAGSGNDATALMRRHEIDAVFLDISGSCEREPTLLTAMQIEAPHRPVIALAGSAPDHVVVSALDLGALAFMREPYDLDVAKALLRRALALRQLSRQIEETERRLRESTERFRSLVEHTPDAVVLADHQGHIMMWNRGAQRLFAYTADEVLGQPLTLLMPDRYRAAHQQGLARFRFTGTPRIAGTTTLLHGLRKDGSEFPLELSVAAWKTRQGVAYGGIMRDISQRCLGHDHHDGEETSFTRQCEAPAKGNQPGEDTAWLDDERQ
ncbi:MAG: PAS domain S-box protein [Nitrospirota bacterium]|nr:PAS domain S-box protein [Nitrospirota bacterium]MDE3242929.1 PAS domain S-box protein [Nitrospirota bacterium]